MTPLCIPQHPPHLMRQKPRCKLGAIRTAVPVKHAEQAPRARGRRGSECNPRVAVVFVHVHARALRAGHAELSLEARPLREDGLLPLQALLPLPGPDGGRGDQGPDSQPGRGDDRPRLGGQAPGMEAKLDQLRVHLFQGAAALPRLQHGGQDADHRRRLHARPAPLLPNELQELPARGVAAIEDAHEDFAQGIDVVVEGVGQVPRHERVNVHEVEVTQRCRAHRPAGGCTIHERNTKIGDYRSAPRAQQNVRRLQIPVLHSLAVTMLESLGQLPHDSQRLICQLG
mmetsp:Transcript_79439/g.233450  ORF Transcript_79439/g.233450 Transcript_79439/m.233450 type:complete len:285 (-) Transcript_79439:693-1547(-)